MNEQAQMVALLLAGFIAGGEPHGGDMMVEAASPKPQIANIGETGCRLVRRHVSAEDVAYSAGTAVRSQVSVDGKPVAVVSGGLAAPKLERVFSYEMRPVYEFAVKIQPFPSASRFHEETSLEVATIGFDPQTRRVTVDGKELVWLHEQAIIDSCENSNKNKNSIKNP